MEQLKSIKESISVFCCRKALAQDAGDFTVDNEAISERNNVSFAESVLIARPLPKSTTDDDEEESSSGVGNILEPSMLGNSDISRMSRSSNNQSAFNQYQSLAKQNISTRGKAGMFNRPSLLQAEKRNKRAEEKQGQRLLSDSINEPQIDLTQSVSGIDLNQTDYKSFLTESNTGLKVSNGSILSSESKLKSSRSNQSSAKKTALPDFKESRISMANLTEQSIPAPSSIICAERYNIKVSKQNIDDLIAGKADLGPVFDFYLNYLEEKTNKGLGISQAQRVKALGSKFYKDYTVKMAWDSVSKLFKASEEPTTAQYDRIIFLVHRLQTQRWYVVVYNKSLKNLTIMTPEEYRSNFTPTIKQILNWDEKREILHAISRFIHQEHFEKTQSPFPYSSIKENYITEIPLCTNPADYGFHILELLRRVFYGYRVNAEFDGEALNNFKSKFSDFIRNFGKQNDRPNLIYDALL